MASGERPCNRDRRRSGTQDRIIAARYRTGCSRRGCRCRSAHPRRNLRPLLTRTRGGAMRNVFIMAGKEIQECLRNRWVLSATLLLAALALSLTFLGSAPTGNVGVRPLDVVIVSLSSLSIFLLPLIALLISHDAIIGEIERGTMLLLLSYPVGRWQVLFGK